MRINSVIFLTNIGIHYEGMYYCMIFEFFLSKYFRSYAEVMLNYAII